MTDLLRVIAFCFVATTAQVDPAEKPSEKEDASELVIPEKFPYRVKKIGANLYRASLVSSYSAERYLT